MLKLWGRLLANTWYDDMSVGGGNKYTPPAKKAPEGGVQISNIQGQAEVNHGGVWHKAQEGEVLHDGDSVRTGRDSRLDLTRSNGVVDRVSNTTTVTFHVHEEHGQLRELLEKLFDRTFHNHPAANVAGSVG